MSTCKNCKNKCASGSDFCTECQSLIDKLDFDDINAERKWLEELFVGRLNNFLLILSLIVAAGFANNFTTFKSFVFYFGAVLSLLCWIPLNRTYHKYDNAVRIILSQETFKLKKKGKKPNPIKIVQSLYLRRKGNMFKCVVVSKLLVYWIPFACIVFLLLTGLGIDFYFIK